jgi:putative ABC transport system permease protein
MRSLLSILLIGVPVTLILCLVGLSYGIIEDSQTRQRGIGADILVRPKNSSYLTLNGAPIPQQLVAFLAKQPGIRMATGVVNINTEGVTLGAAGINFPEFNAMSGGFKFIEGGPFQRPNDVVIDDFYADQKKKKVGDTLQIHGVDWHVSGIIKSGMLAHIVMPIETLQEKTEAVGKVSQIYLKVQPGASVNSVIQSLKQLPGFEDYPIYSMEEFAALLNIGNVPGLQPFILVIMGIGVVIGFAVVCLSMYMAVLQRTREIGILKSLGGSKSFILRVILSEALLLGIGGSILGILMSYGAYWLIKTLVPASLPMIIVYRWWPIAAGITLAGALLGSLYPGLTAAAHDPIEALAYE